MTVLDKSGLDQSALHISEAMPRDYLALLKPRVMSLVVFTAFVGLVTTQAAINPLIATVAILAISVGAGASGALNMWYDADLDAVMSRTAKRPVPMGRILPNEALTFGIVLAAFSVVTLGLATNWFAAGFLAFTIVFYGVFYTIYLKRRTPQNIVIGGAAGAFPPMIGAAAVTGWFTLDSFLLFLIIFLWTPPHFWALALFKSDDYRRAGVPMLPNVAGAAATKKQILVYSALLAASSVLPWALGSAGPVYGVAAGALGIGFVWHGWKVFRMAEDDEAMLPAKSLFGYSLIYLFAIFAVYLLEALLRANGALMW